MFLHRSGGLEGNAGDAGEVWYHCILRHHLPDGCRSLPDGGQVKTSTVVSITVKPVYTDMNGAVFSVGIDRVSGDTVKAEKDCHMKINDG